MTPPKGSKQRPENEEIAKDLSRSKRVEDAKRQGEWDRLVRAEHDAFQLCCKLDADAEGKKNEKARAVQDWWSKTAKLLNFYWRTKGLEGIELTPFPMDVLSRLANISSEISDGITPTIVKDAGKMGRQLHYGEKRHLALAVEYMAAVKRGDINDKAPNKTVREAYNVTSRAVQGWCKRASEILEHFDFSRMKPEQLKQEMQKAGAIYARIGRSAPSE
ncbi:MAG: hypothetical protein AAF636_26930 [Pseudomonadota bacterium]